MFTTLTNRESSISSCDGVATLKVLSYRPVNVTFISPSSKYATATLLKVSYAPNSRCNLISLPNLANKANISFQGDKTQITLSNEQGQDFAVALRKHCLYCFKLKQVSTITTPKKSLIDIAAAAVNFEDKV